MVDLIDDDHAYIVCNSYDINQCDEVLDLIQKTKNCLIHSVIRFMRDKISSDMFKVFDLDDVKVMWDTHGKIPEEYHKASNFHTEKVTEDIEKTFAQKADVIICDSDKMCTHFKKKYKDTKADLIVM